MFMKAKNAGTIVICNGRIVVVDFVVSIVRRFGGNRLSGKILAKGIPYRKDAVSHREVHVIHDAWKRGE